MAQPSYNYGQQTQAQPQKPPMAYGPPPPISAGGGYHPPAQNLPPPPQSSKFDHVLVGCWIYEFKMRIKSIVESTVSVSYVLKG